MMSTISQDVICMLNIFEITPSDPANMPFLLSTATCCFLKLRLDQLDDALTFFTENAASFPISILKIIRGAATDVYSDKFLIDQANTVVKLNDAIFERILANANP